MPPRLFPCVSNRLSFARPKRELLATVHRMDRADERCAGAAGSNRSCQRRPEVRPRARQARRYRTERDLQPICDFPVLHFGNDRHEQHLAKLRGHSFDGGRQRVVGEYVPARIGGGSTGFQNFLTPRVDSASPAPPQLMLDNVYQNLKQPRPHVCARLELVEDLPGAQACLLDCILGSAGIPQHMESLAIKDGQIGQSDRLKFSIAIQADVTGVDVPPQGLGLNGVTGCSHIVSFVRSVGELRLIS